MQQGYFFRVCVVHVSLSFAILGRRDEPGLGYSSTSLVRACDVGGSGHIITYILVRFGKPHTIHAF